MTFLEGMLDDTRISKPLTIVGEIVRYLSVVDCAIRVCSMIQYCLARDLYTSLVDIQRQNSPQYCVTKVSK